MFAHGSAFQKLFLIVCIFLRSVGLICYDKWVLSEAYKNYFKDSCLMKSLRTFLFLNQWIIVILSKACKPNNFELRNSLKLSFTSIQALRSNFVDCKYFLEWKSPEILALCEINLDYSIDSGNFSVRGYLHLSSFYNPKEF